VTAVQKAGDDVLAEVVGGFGIFLIINESFPQNAPVKYINTHGGVGGLGNLGLLLEFVDGIVGVGVEDAEAGGFLQRDIPHGDGAGGIVLFVVGNHCGVVHLVDMVTGEDHHILRIKTLDKVNVLIDGVGGALVPAALLVVPFVGGQDLRAAVGLVQAPGLAVADVFIQLQRLILGQNAHGIDAGVDAVTQGEINNAVFAAKGNSGLGSLFSEDLQSASLTAGQQHSNAALLLEIHSYTQLLIILVP